MNIEEARLIAHKLGVSWQDFKAEYADPRWPFDHSLLLRHLNGACPFLQVNCDRKEGLCRIHSYKPACCREWEYKMDRADCREGLKAVWDLEISESGKVCGKREKLDEFSAFLRSISSPDSDTSKI